MSDKDRIPSEIFEILSALRDDGTQAARISRLKNALESLLHLILESDDGAPNRTIYDSLAIEAWRQGIIPPKKRRGRKGTNHDKAAIDLLRKAQFRKCYRDLAAADPQLLGAERLEIVADRFDLDVEWLNNVVRSSLTTVLKASSDPAPFPDLLDMWLEWEAGRTN